MPGRPLRSQARCPRASSRRERSRGRVGLPGRRDLVPRAQEGGERTVRVLALASVACGLASLEFRFCYRLNCAPQKSSEVEVLTRHLRVGPEWERGLCRSS